MAGLPRRRRPARDGTLLGKSVIVLRAHATAERMAWICDVLESGLGDDEAYVAENIVSCAGLTRAAFEATYEQ